MNKQNQKEAKKLPSFYIALCCCVLVIGIAGYFTEKRTVDSSSTQLGDVSVNEGDDEPVFSSDMDKYAEPALADPTPEPNIEAPASADEPENVDTPVIASQEIAGSEDYAVDNPDVEDNAITVAAAPSEFVMPVEGDILEAFSPGLVYNSALCDWRTHSGVDIAAEQGCSIQSAANGIIDKISETAMGGFVQISHAGGFVTRYVGLENVENLTEGKEIQSGEVIGTLGECKGENVTRRICILK